MVRTSGSGTGPWFFPFTEDLTPPKPKVMTRPFPAWPQTDDLAPYRTAPRNTHDLTPCLMDLASKGLAPYPSPGTQART